MKSPSLIAATALFGVVFAHAQSVPDRFVDGSLPTPKGLWLFDATNTPYAATIGPDLIPHGGSGAQTYPVAGLPPGDGALRNNPGLNNFLGVPFGLPSGTTSQTVYTLAWDVRCPAADSLYRSLLQTDPANSNPADLQIYRGRIGSAELGFPANALIGLRDMNWHRVVVSVNNTAGGQCRIYIDGAPDFSPSVTLPLASLNLTDLFSFFAGTNNNAVETSQILFFDQALTAAQAGYLAGSSMLPPAGDNALPPTPTLAAATPIQVATNNGFDVTLNLAAPSDGDRTILELDYSNGTQTRLLSSWLPAGGGSTTFSVPCQTLPVGRYAIRARTIDQKLGASSWVALGTYFLYAAGESVFYVPSGSWHTASKWMPAAVPGPTTAAHLLTNAIVASPAFAKTVTLWDGGSLRSVSTLTTDALLTENTSRPSATFLLKMETSALLSVNQLVLPNRSGSMTLDLSPGTLSNRTTAAVWFGNTNAAPNSSSVTLRMSPGAKLMATGSQVSLGLNTAFSAARTNATLRTGPLTIGHAKNGGAASGLFTLSGGLLQPSADAAVTFGWAESGSSGQVLFTNILCGAASLPLNDCVIGRADAGSVGITSVLRDTCTLTTAPGKNLVIGQGSAAVVTTTLEGQAMIGVGGDLLIGYNTTNTALLRMNGGSLGITNNLVIGAGAAGHGSFALNGGSLLCRRAILVADGASTSGTFTQTSGVAETADGLAAFAGGTCSLSGSARLKAPALLGMGAQTVFTADGGTLQTTQTALDVLFGFETAQLLAGGLTVEAAHDIWLSQTFTGTGGLTKTGVATLDLRSEHQRLGALSVQGGTLVLSAADAHVGPATVAADAHLALLNPNITVAAIALADQASLTLPVDFDGTIPATIGPITPAGAFTLSLVFFCDASLTAQGIILPFATTNGLTLSSSQAELVLENGQVRYRLKPLPLATTPAFHIRQEDLALLPPGPLDALTADGQTFIAAATTRPSLVTGLTNPLGGTFCALAFDGDDALTNIAPVAASFSGDVASFTVTVWLNAQSGNVLAWGRETAANSQALVTMADSALGFGSSLANYRVGWGALGLPRSNCWHFIAVTYDQTARPYGQRTALFVDGQRLTAEEYNPDALVGLLGDGFTLGGRVNSDGVLSTFLKGWVADLAVYGETLTQDDVLARLNAEKQRYWGDDPISYYTAVYERPGVGAWADPARWSAGHVPDRQPALVRGSNVTATLTGIVAPVRSLLVEDQACLDIDGGSLQITGPADTESAFSIGYRTPASAIFRNGAAIISTNAPVVFGSGPAAQNVVARFDHATLTAGRGMWLAHDGASASVELNATTWNVLGGDWRVGAEGHATVAATLSALAVAGDVVIGPTNASSCDVSLDRCSLTLAQALKQQTSQVAATNSLLTVADGLIVGYDEGGGVTSDVAACLTFTGPDTVVTCNGGIVIGHRRSSGRLVIENGATVVANPAATGLPTQLGGSDGLPGHTRLDILSGGFLDVRQGPLLALHTNASHTSICLGEGGRLQTGVIQDASAVTTCEGTFFFDGGTLVAREDLPDWYASSLPLVASAQALARFDTAGFTATLTHPLTGAGGLCKLGGGTLFLADGAPAYLGPTVVSNGVLTLPAVTVLSNDVTVATEGTLTLGADSAIGSLTLTGTLRGDGLILLDAAGSAVDQLRIGGTTDSLPHFRFVSHGALDETAAFTFLLVPPAYSGPVPAVDFPNPGWQVKRSGEGFYAVLNNGTALLLK